MSTPNIMTLLLQAQALLNDADEANHAGAWETFALQRQARAVVAEAIDELLAIDDQDRINSAA